jgi:S-adenosylmethionine synthetase
MIKVELVLRGHPDMLADAIAKNIVEYGAKKFEDSKTPIHSAIEVLCDHKTVTISGEVNWEFSEIEITDIARSTLFEEALSAEEIQQLNFVCEINNQSQEIASIVQSNGTGDNGIYYGGYDRTYSKIIDKLKDICYSLDKETVESFNYRTDGKLIAKIDIKNLSIILNIASHKEYYTLDKPKKAEFQEFLEKLFSEKGLNLISLKINPRGDWNECFMFADTGLTGRKLSVQSSCGLFPHGGGACHGKDISKSDVTMPLYLQERAKKMFSIRNKILLASSSIIGDTELDIYLIKDNGNWEQIESVTYENIKQWIKEYDINIYGQLKGKE